MSLMPQYPRSRQIPYYETNIQPWMFLKNANTDCTAEHQHRSHFRICTKHFLQLLLEDGKENILKFSFTPNVLSATSSVEACWIAWCFFLHSYSWQNFTCSRWQGLASLRQWWLDKCQPEDKHDQELEKCHLILTLLSIALWKQNGNTLGAYARVAVMPCK